MPFALKPSLIGRSLMPAIGGEQFRLERVASPAGLSECETAFQQSGGGLG
jgi:hypothetical protein